MPSTRGTFGTADGFHDSSQDDSQERRFYDHEPAVKSAIGLLAELTRMVADTPNQAIALIVAKGMSLFAIRDFNAHEKIDPQFVSQRKSLGAKAVLALYKSKQKKRGYDSNPDLHNAINHLRVLSREERIIVSTKVLDMARYVTHYMDVCETARRAPSDENVQRIRDTYIIKGEAETSRYVEAVCIDLLKTLPSPNKASNAVKLREEDVMAPPPGEQMRHYDDRS